MALYLKYRPQNLDSLIGQTQVKQTILSSWQQNRLSHAYLLVGPRGTGKTSTARILAKMVNCEGKSPPCNSCQICLSITNGSNLDLIEIDAASNRGIDDIRSLRETIKLSPSSSKKKVYIIDEVHMLTPEAFNALLKTLEEPPSHALFILATTEVQKIPATILSRVTRLDFKLATVADLLEALKKIVDGEKIKIEGEALQLLAKKADGSFRDAVKLLDQLSSKGTGIKLKDVEESLSMGNFESSLILLEKMAKGDSTGALLSVVNQTQSGIQIKDYILFLMDILRGLVFIKNDLGLQLVKQDFGSDKYQQLAELSGQFSVRDVIKALDSLQNALEKMKIASIPSLPLELAVVEICSVPISANLKSEPAGPAGLQPHSMSSSATGGLRALNVAPRSPSPADPEKGQSKADISKLNDKWSLVLETIRQQNFSLEALLRSAKIIDCSNGLVTIEVPYAFHQRILEQPKSRDLLEGVLSDVLSGKVAISTVLGMRPPRIEDIANIEVAQEDEVITLASEIFNGKLLD